MARARAILERRIEETRERKKKNNDWLMCLIFPFWINEDHHLESAK